MTDREKVIKALECCTKKVCCYNDTERECPYWELCGGYEDAFEDCTTALSKDALALLKAQEPIEARLNLCESCTKEYAECEADKTDLVYGSGVGNDNVIGCPWYVNRWKVQEPRVMTLEELIGIYNFRENHSWVYDTPPYLYLDNRTWIGYWVSWSNIVGCLEGQEAGYKVEKYGKTWRCWTSRPDEKRRAETPWN